jgi:hypothetical protein
VYARPFGSNTAEGIEYVRGELPPVVDEQANVTGVICTVTVTVDETHSDLDK